MAVASMIIGIIGLAGLIPLIGWLFVVLNILAIIFGSIALFIEKEQRGMAIVGIVTGAIPLVIKVIFYFFFFITALMSQ